MKIIKTLYLSTRHMTKEDNERIERGSAHLCSEDTEFGWIINVDLSVTGFNKLINALTEEQFSMAFINIISLAHNNGCEWVRFDCEGPVEGCIPQFNW